MEDSSRVRYRGVVQLQRRGNSVMLTIRRPYMALLGLNAGDTVVCDVVGKVLVVTPIEDQIRACKTEMVRALGASLEARTIETDEVAALVQSQARSNGQSRLV